MRIGFIGTGAITQAIVTGLCTAPFPPEAIWVSARNEQKALALETAHSQVRIAAPNQAVVDNSDILFLAVLPGQETDVLNPLKFSRDQVIVTLLAGVPISGIRALTAPARTVIRAIPLPCTALRTGPVVMFPHHDKVHELFASVGSVIVPEQEDQLEVFSMITALMAPFYALTDTVAAWGESRGLDQAQAAAYTGAMFKALALIAETAPGGDIRTLVADSMTPGGLNETAMGVISDTGGFKTIVQALDRVAEKFK